MREFFHSKILLTTSHRPSRNARRLVKVLAKLIPGCTKINRGKLTFKLLALQALDLNCDKLIVVRNRKGNPGYLDLYAVKPFGELIKECTVKLCGYSVSANYNKIAASIQRVLLNLMPALISNTVDIDTEFKIRTLECIIKIFNATVVSKNMNIERNENDVCMHITIPKIGKKSCTKKRNLIEITFTRCSNGEKLLSLNICYNSYG
jgi:rRNA maturation protein Rpf1